MKSIFDVGRQRANPSAGKNMARIATKATAEGTPSEDTITVTASGNFESFVFAGVTKTLDTAIAVTSPDDIRDALVEYITKNGVSEEIDPIVDVSYAGGDLTIRHVGHLALESVGISDVSSGAQQSTTRKSTIKTTVKYEAELVGTVGDVSYDGSTDTLANDPYAYSGTSGTDATTAGTLATDLGTLFSALSVPVVSGSIAVTVDDDNELYRASFEVESLETVIKFDNVAPKVKAHGYTFKA